MTDILTYGQTRYENVTDRHTHEWTTYQNVIEINMFGSSLVSIFIQLMYFHSDKEMHLHHLKRVSCNQLKRHGIVLFMYWRQK